MDVDAHKYSTLLDILKRAFHHVFFDNHTKAYAGGYQTVQILPLYFNVTPPAQQASVVAALPATSENNDGDCLIHVHQCARRQSRGGQNHYTVDGHG